MEMKDLYRKSIILAVVRNRLEPRSAQKGGRKRGDQLRTQQNKHTSPLVIVSSDLIFFGGEWELRWDELWLNSWRLKQCSALSVGSWF
jgi:hypothetical protein